MSSNRKSEALVLGISILAGYHTALAQDAPIRLEDLEEIPRDEWPDLGSAAYQAFPLNSSLQEGSFTQTDFDEPFAVDPDTLYQVPIDDPKWSPFVVNGQTYADYERTRQTQRLLEVEDTSESNVCKKCIDSDKRWCPSSNYSSGRCCSGEHYSSCTRQGYCSDEFNVTELQYLLCPNELGCTFSRYLIPQTNGQETSYEMFDGTFLSGDICNFKITNPPIADLNDVMYMRLKHISNCRAVLIKGESMTNPISMYTLKTGQEYTAL